MPQSNAQADNFPRDVKSIGWPFEMMNKLADFFIGYIDRLPKRLRPVAYFVLLAFFCASAWRLIAGPYIVRGAIWNGNVPARGYELHLAGDYLSTNEHGMYYALLSSQDYYRFLATGAEFEVMLRQPPLGHLERVPGSPFKVEMRWLDNRFDDINLTAIAKSSKPSGTPAEASYTLIASAYAQELPVPAPDRLVIERITLGSSAIAMREVDFEIELGRKDAPLLLQGLKAGDLPMKPAVTFGESYYFEVPQDRRGKLVSIEMESTASFFGFNKEEEFEFLVPTQYNRELIVPGTRDSRIILRLVPGTTATKH